MTQDIVLEVFTEAIILAFKLAGFICNLNIFFLCHSKLLLALFFFGERLPYGCKKSSPGLKGFCLSLIFKLVFFTILKGL